MKKVFWIWSGLGSRDRVKDREGGIVLGEGGGRDRYTKV